jgi:hypothetical protein
MILDFFFQLLQLALDLVEETAVRAANRLVAGFVQPDQSVRVFSFWRA